MKERELKSILVIILGLLAFYTYLLIRKDNNVDALLYAALCVGFFSLLIPNVGQGIVWLWFKIAEILGWINSHILLGLLYIICLTPLSFLYRLFKKNTLDIKAPEKSIYEERNYTYKSEDLDNIW